MVPFDIGDKLKKWSSCTKKPATFTFANSTAITLVDGPGFDDTNGICADVCNSIGFHDILSNANSILILICMEANPMTSSSGRGKISLMVFDYLRSIFIKDDFTEYIDGIIPVILRAEDPNKPLALYKHYFE